MDDNRCAVAIVGAGNMAREHARAFADVPGVTLTGIYSRTPARAAALASEFAIAHVASTLDDLYKRSAAQLVVVTVSDDQMCAVSEEACRYPWTMLIEKPPGLNLGEAHRIRESATANQRTVLVALQRRFYSVTSAVAAGLESDSGPRHISVQDQQSREVAISLGLAPAVVQHWMYVNSIHLIDYFRVLGRGRISAVRTAFPWRESVPHVVAATVEFDSGDTGSYEAIWRGPGPWAVSVTTAATRWELRPLEQLHVQRSGQRTRETVEASAWDRSFKPGLRAQAEAAVAVALGRPSRSVTLDDALGTMHLVASIYGHA